MSDIAIRVEHLGKAYQISHEQGRSRYRTLQEEIIGAIKRPFSRSADKRETFWALKDVSFEVKVGEALGIIGRNGAGKSTLLKILSRITRPTTGYADVYGRVGSLLEVGTGFHPELTGRENIYLNGAILGMTRRDIQRRFDEIVAFAEVENFLDTPVKRYSSGMYMRLAFAVAAHLEPEILVVDEVLAVGDAEFQKKCLGKMGDVAKEGRTVLFVSHNMSAITKLCNRGLCLADGEIILNGSTDEAVGMYLRQSHGSNVTLSFRNIEVSVAFENTLGTTIDVWDYNEPLLVKVRIESSESLKDPAIDLAFYSDTGVRLFSARSDSFKEQSLQGTFRQIEFEFSFINVGIACNLLSVDVGLRINQLPEYLTWWQAVATLVVSQRKAPSYLVPETLICLPSQFKVIAN
jgi:lipopolysaccharide transport system ATP-binding protein